MSGRVRGRFKPQTRRLVLVATTCAGCGTVGLYWNGKLLKTINLNATETNNKAVRGSWKGHRDEATFWDPGGEVGDNVVVTD